MPHLIPQQFPHHPEPPSAIGVGHGPNRLWAARALRLRVGAEMDGSCRPKLFGLRSRRDAMNEASRTWCFAIQARRQSLPYYRYELNNCPDNVPDSGATRVEPYRAPWRSARAMQSAQRLDAYIYLSAFIAAPSGCINTK